VHAKEDARLLDELAAVDAQLVLSARVDVILEEEGRGVMMLKEDREIPLLCCQVMESFGEIAGRGW